MDGQQSTSHQKKKGGETIETFTLSKNDSFRNSCDVFSRTLCYPQLALPTFVVSIAACIPVSAVAFMASLGASFTYDDARATPGHYPSGTREQWAEGQRQAQEFSEIACEAAFVPLTWNSRLFAIMNPCNSHHEPKKITSSKIVEIVTPVITQQAGHPSSTETDPLLAD